MSAENNRKEMFLSVAFPTMQCFCRAVWDYPAQELASHCSFLNPRQPQYNSKRTVIQDLNQTAGSSLAEPGERLTFLKGVFCVTCQARCLMHSDPATLTTELPCGALKPLDPQLSHWWLTGLNSCGTRKELETKSHFL